ncbi:CMTR2 [Symbiodinium natans]|uniref:CMTR2 protein n=1 Tax=Symbiodinium natans TaxID=878477 RepID=A0A812I817_9DINO|nr:CMTR2 [Symbiodinium natans]
MLFPRWFAASFCEVEPGRWEREAALATLVAALGGLRVGGCLILHSPHRGQSLAGLVQHLFERTELVAVPRNSAGEPEVFLVGWQFRGVQPALLQALSGAVSKELSAKQSPELVDAALLHPSLSGRLEAWQRLVAEGPRSAPRTLASMPVQLHLLWGHCHESLLQGPPGATGAQQLDFTRLAQRRQRLWCTEAPAAKRARLTPVPPSEKCRSWCQGWRQMMRSREADRVLLQTLEVSAEAAVTAAKLWWKEVRLQPPWTLVHSTFAEPQKLYAGISARLEREERGGVEVARLPDEAPPLLAAFIDLLATWLPKRLSKGGEALACQQCFCVMLPGGDETVPTWLRNEMGMSQCHALRVTPDGSAAARGQADLTLVELCPDPDSHPSCELAGLECQPAWRRDAVGAITMAFRAVAPGGDMFLQLPSLFTRFTAGVCWLSLCFIVSRIDTEISSKHGCTWLICSSYVLDSAGRPLPGMACTRMLKNDMPNSLNELKKALQVPKSPSHSRQNSATYKLLELLKTVEVKLRQARCAKAAQQQLLKSLAGRAHCEPPILSGVVPNANLGLACFAEVGELLDDARPVEEFMVEKDQVGMIAVVL